MQSQYHKDQNFNYYHEYCRLFLASTVLLTQMRELYNQRNQITTLFTKLEKKGAEIQQGENYEDDRKKRFRRTANEIERHYRCPVQSCQRSYGSEGSLNQHLKLKHYDLYIQLGLNNITQNEINSQNPDDQSKS